mmetsp:Transcript_1360/g.3585  ORF Transcript_1360/g.3585 Transcript_1360/m.3585 type:complete len:82 (-) Transcript_1360:1655-1900(-)
MAKLPYSLAKDKKRAKHDERTELNTYANSFAEKLLVTYGIGHKQCHDGILLLYSVQDHMAGESTHRHTDACMAMVKRRIDA